MKLLILIGLFTPHLCKTKAAALKGEAPAGLPLKGAGQDSSDAQPKVTIYSKSDAVAYLYFYGSVINMF